MKLRHLKGALDPILVEGTDDLYIRADFVWDEVDFDFEANTQRSKFPEELLAAFAKGKVLLHGDKLEVVTPEDVKGEPPLVVGKLASAVMSTLVMYGMGRPSDPKPEPKTRSRATRS